MTAHKVVILAGGYGTRLSEETELRPKPMVEIGGKPILWHIMKLYSSYGFNQFVICLGYKGYIIKEFFSNYFLHQSDVTIHLAENKMDIHNSNSEPWVITLVDTGVDTMTGGRVKRIQPYVGNEPFLLTYGDGLGDINMTDLLAFHRSHRRLATITAVQPLGRFGALELEGNLVRQFEEKPHGDGGWINGGFFVLNPGIFDYISDDQTILEKTPLENLAADQQLMAYPHHGFWKPMDTLRDKIELNHLWDSGQAAWKKWA
ncbi:MAG: glucose-1-phosphate cytidylyltransferase [Candidatus Margulisiibacteriota bacterium]